MTRAEFSYTQLCIGDCGHICDAWPLVSRLGESGQVVCRECTAKEYGLDHDEASGLAVWVRVKEKNTAPKTNTPKPRKRKEPKPNVWDQFMPGSG